MNRLKGNVLFQSLVLTLFISLFPLKIASYFLPVILLVFVFFKLPSKILYKNLFYAALIFVIVLLFYFLKSFFFHYDFSFVGAFLALLTYGSLIFFLIYPNFNVTYDSATTNKINKFLFIVFILETVVGLLQLVFFVSMHITSLDSATGDIIQGTINPFSFINEKVGFNNQVFTINYVFLLIYLVPYLRKTRRRYFLVIGVVMVIMASVLHVIFSFLLALFSCYLFVGFIRYRKQLIKYLLFGTSLIFILFVTQPKNFSLFNSYYSTFISFESPKSLILINTFVFLPQEYPDVLLLGLGPGQYTSRASLITTGRYIGEFDNPVKIPLMDGTHTNKAFKDYVFNTWEEYAINVEQYGNSTISRPFFSFLSLCIEFGVINFLILAFMLFRKLIRIRRQYIFNKENKKLESYYPFVNIISILFLFYLSFFENYLESSASIFAGLLLIKYFDGLKQDTLVSNKT